MKKLLKKCNLSFNAHNSNFFIKEGSPAKSVIKKAKASLSKTVFLLEWGGGDGDGDDNEPSRVPAAPPTSSNDSSFAHQLISIYRIQLEEPTSLLMFPGNISVAPPDQSNFLPIKWWVLFVLLVRSSLGTSFFIARGFFFCFLREMWC